MLKRFEIQVLGGSEHPIEELISQIGEGRVWNESSEFACKKTLGVLNHPRNSLDLFLG